MKQKKFKAFSVLLALCMLLLYSMAVYTNASGTEDNNEKNINSLDALEEEEFRRAPLKVMKSIYDTNLVLTEEEIKHGVPMPSGND